MVKLTKEEVVESVKKPYITDKEMFDLEKKLGKVMISETEYRNLKSENVRLLFTVCIQNKVIEMQNKRLKAFQMLCNDIWDE